MSAALPPGARAGDAEPLGSREQQLARRCLGVLGVLAAASMLGVAFSPYLLSRAPLLLIALSPIGRHLVLVAPLVDPGVFVALTAGRRMLFYAASYGLGRALGARGIPWIEARAARFGRFVRIVERIFARAPRLIVLVMAGPTTSALAGISGMRPGVFLPLAVVSLVLRALLILGFAAWIEDYLLAVLDWVERYWLPATLATASAVALHRWRRRRTASKLVVAA